MTPRMDQHFTYRSLIMFVLPSIVMMVFTSLYSIVDGFFVSNFAGKEALAAVNLVFPIANIVSALGFMFGAGGSALVAKTLGEGQPQRARGIFTGICIVAAGTGVVASIGMLAALKPIMELIGVEAQVIGMCMDYGRWLMLGVPFFIVCHTFESFFIASGKPTMGLVTTVTAGVVNIALDWILVGILGWGVTGAALATSIAQAGAAVVGMVFFTRKRSVPLYFTRPTFHGADLAKTCTNGLSELVGNIASSVVSTLYNAQLLAYAGTDGVAAYSAMMYVNFIFAGVYFGFAMGSAPLISFHYGAGNRGELHNLLRRGLVVMATVAGFMFAASELSAVPLSAIFVGYDPALMAMTVHGFRVFDFVFLFMGFGVWGSSFFTALNNGLVSAVIGLLRTLVFETSSVLVLPLAFGLDGIWASATVAEVLSVTVTAIFLVALRREYGYWPATHGERHAALAGEGVHPVGAGTPTGAGADKPV